MLSKSLSLKQIAIYGGLAMTLAFLPARSARSQIVPNVWGTIGVEDSDISYGAGVKMFGFGLEVGTIEDGATGADLLKFINLPIVSPYVGLGWYPEDDDSVALSGGVHVHPPGNVFFGAGYHTIRGVNGQLGVKF